MFGSMLQNRAARWLSVAALAAYGSAGVLGHGLHHVWQCEHGLSGLAAHASTDCCPAERIGHDSDRSVQSSIGQSGDDCTICSFLAQAQSSFVSPLAADGVEPLPEAPMQAASLALLRPCHFADARGPPLA